MLDLRSMKERDEIRSGIRTMENRIERLKAELERAKVEKARLQKKLKYS